MPKKTGGAGKPKTPAQKTYTRRRTSRNKIRAVEKALKTAGGKQVEVLKKRLEYWRENQGRKHHQ